jgi:4-hydroxybenzoate polyprenyltransferase
MMFHRDAMGLALQKAPKTNFWYNPAAIAWEVVTDTIYGVAEMRDDHAVLVKT